MSLVKIIDNICNIDWSQCHNYDLPEDKIRLEKIFDNICDIDWGKCRNYKIPEDK